MSDGRSPLRDRQLHDLRLLPTATDPRPTFFWSAEGSRDTVVTHSEFPKLLWSDTGVEITVRSKEEQDSKIAQGYVFVAPASVVVDPMADLSDALAGLSDEERTLVLEAQQAQRRAEITAKLAGLSPEALEKLLAGATEPAKKRGRPAKVA
jgi:hypothetical protein